MRETCESKYRRIRNNLNGFFKLDTLLGYDSVCNTLHFEPFIISRLYGYFKVQRDDFPVRPIVSSSNYMGKSLAGSDHSR